MEVNELKAIKWPEITINNFVRAFLMGSGKVGGMTMNPIILDFSKIEAINLETKEINGHQFYICLSITGNMFLIEDTEMVKLNGGEVKKSSVLLT